MVEMVPLDKYVWRVTQNYASCAVGDAQYMTFTSHFYIIVGESKISFIDAGCGIDILSVLNVVDNNQFKKYDKDLMCIITHWHDDHVYGLKTITSGNKSINIFAHEHDTRNIKTEIPNIAMNNICDGDRIDLGNIEITIHHTPGHTKGSISVSSDKGHLFTGDAFLGGQDVTFVSDSSMFMR